MQIGLNVKYLLLLSEFNNYIIFWTDFWNRIQTISIKTHPVAEEVLHADTQTAKEQTDKTMLIVRFPVFLIF